MTFNTGDAKTPPEIHAQLERIEAELDEAGSLCSADQPCGAGAYYDEDEALPWRISDDHTSESYATLDEAILAAQNWSYDD